MCVWLDVEMLRGWLGGVKFWETITNKMWAWGEWLLCSLWPRLSCILRSAFMYNLICFTNNCIELSLTIILAKHNTMLDNLMTRPLIWAAFIAVAIWICVHWVPALTLDIPEVFHFSPTSANKFRFSAKDRPRGSNWIFSPNYLLSANRPTLCSWRSP